MVLHFTIKCMFHCGLIFILVLMLKKIIFLSADIHLLTDNTETMIVYIYNHLRFCFSSPLVHNNPSTNKSYAALLYTLSESHNAHTHSYTHIRLIHTHIDIYSHTNTLPNTCSHSHTHTHSHTL